MARHGSRILLLVTGLGLGLGGPAGALEVAGVEVPESLVVGGRSLRLNGAGLRSRLFVKVYVGALYLEQKSGDPAAILAAEAPWAVILTFRRDVDHHKILDAFVAAFELNSPGQLPQLTPQLELFHAVLGDLHRDDVLVLHYLPGAGTRLTVPGGATALVPGHLFAEAVLRSWLGEHPADTSLKDALLGR
jgi:hypothetical protein